ncbi:arylsulfatase B-like [Belonocnema kinseyi]|uniref:arylsulfatase B-like n=1 Tax=Belonocnema kinseyi TaxID=2817044 RepID=UPI00143D16D1|nr:arylsulfatase B-like [Belonocnema kinseyi]
MSMTSRKAICAFVISILYLIDKCEGKKPHIIVIIADDLGWNDVSFHGSNQIPTPNIDALAYNGVILNRHYTQPTCTPSRTAFLTGLYPIRTGMYGNPLRPSEPNGIPLNFTLFPEHMKKIGYVTRLIGKWHTGYFTANHTPTYRGFDSFFGYYNGYIKYFKHTINDDFHTGHDVHRDYPNNLTVAYPSGYFTDIITQEAEKLIRNHNNKNPLYLQIAHLAVHASDNKDPLEVRDVKEINLKFGHIKNIKRRKYAGMVHALDESVGRTVRALQNANMLKDSIILFISDNGAQSVGHNVGSNYPLRGLKFTTYEGGVRGVACIYSPLIKNAQRVSNDMIHITDWLPTFYSAAGGNIANLGELDGVDQWSTVQVGERSSRDFILINIDRNSRNVAAILGNFKLIKSPLYSKYYGDLGHCRRCPAYNLTSIILSLSNQAINTVSNVKLTLTKIPKLRSMSHVRCRNLAKFIAPVGTSLFDIFNDPCESINVYSKYPEITWNLKHIINDYRQVMMQHNLFDRFSDPASYPENFRGSWMPWIDKL